MEGQCAVPREGLWGFIIGLFNQSPRVLQPPSPPRKEPRPPSRVPPSPFFLFPFFSGDPWGGGEEIESESEGGEGEGWVQKGGG